MKLSEAASKVIELARKVREYYDAELPKWHPSYPLVGADDGIAPPPPEEKELKDFLATLSDEIVYQLLMLMDLGRGDIGTDHLADYYADPVNTLGDREHAASEMFHQVALADQLLDGLEELRRHKINVDKMPLKKVKVR
jgi:hypothetical protein